MGFNSAFKELSHILRQILVYPTSVEIIKVVTPTDAQVSLKGVLKFTLKQLQHVSV